MKQKKVFGHGLTRIKRNTYSLIVKNPRISSPLSFKKYMISLHCEPIRSRTGCQRTINRKLIHWCYSCVAINYYFQDRVIRVSCAPDHDKGRDLSVLSDSVAGNSLVPCQRRFLQLEGVIISTDDRISDVLEKCGSPHFRASHQKKMLQRLNADMRQKVYILAEEWTYNLGRTSLPASSY